MSRGRTWSPGHGLQVTCRVNEQADHGRNYNAFEIKVGNLLERELPCCRSGSLVDERERTDHQLNLVTQL